MNRACQRCGVSIEGKRTKQLYCSARCASTKHSGCSVANCTNPHRARGLCFFHWKRQYGKPDRKVSVPCTFCGTVVQKVHNKKYIARFCSLICRDLWRIDTGTNPAPKRATCRIPDDHPARWLGTSCQVPTSHPSRAPRSCPIPWDHPSRLQPRTCGDCGKQYVNSVWDFTSRYCSRTCARRISRRARKAREYGASGSFTSDAFVRLTLALGNICAYCSGDNEGNLFEPDHVIPLSRGGHNGLTNILPACRACNGDKRNLTPAEWAIDRARRGMEPRRTDVHRFTHLTAHSELLVTAA